MVPFSTRSSRRLLIWPVYPHSPETIETLRVSAYRRKMCLTTVTWYPSISWMPGVVTVTIEAPARSLRPPARPSPLRLAAHGPLHDLFTLKPGHAGPGRPYESAYGVVLEIFRDELEFCPGSFDLIQQYPDVVLIAGQPVYRVGEHHVDVTSPEQETDAVNARSLEIGPIADVWDALNHCQPAASA